MTKKSWEYLVNNATKDEIIAYLDEHCYFNKPSEELVNSFLAVQRHKKYLKEMEEITAELEKVDIATDRQKWLKLHKRHIELSEKISELYK